MTIGTLTNEEKIKLLENAEKMGDYLKSRVEGIKDSSMIEIEVDEYTVCFCRTFPLCRNQKSDYKYLFSKKHSDESNEVFKSVYCAPRFADYEINMFYTLVINWDYIKKELEREILRIDAIHRQNHKDIFDFEV